MERGRLFYTFLWARGVGGGDRGGRLDPLAAPSAYSWSASLRLELASQPARRPTLWSGLAGRLAGWLAGWQAGGRPAEGAQICATALCELA